MFKNYFKVAWRNLIRNRTSSLINVSGLAVGIAVSMLIGLWIYDELSFNKCHRNYDRIAQIMTRGVDPKDGPFVTPIILDISSRRRGHRIIFLQPEIKNYPVKGSLWAKVHLKCSH